MHRAILPILILLLLAGQPASFGQAAAEPPPPQRAPLVAERTFFWAGMYWGVSDECGGPGWGCFSNSNRSVWVDSNGFLHLRIRKEGDQWLKAEIFSYQNAQFGPHRFQVFKANPTADGLDPNVIVGMFLFRYYEDTRIIRELDVELTTWNNRIAPLNAQYAAQPANRPGNAYRFALPPGEALGTHEIYWEDAYVRFSSATGARMGGAGAYQTWYYQGPDNPEQSEGLRVILDFWYDDEGGPLNGQEDEVIIMDLASSGICRPAATLSCGQTVTGSTTAPGARNQIDRYPKLDWIEMGNEFAYRFEVPQNTPVNLLLDSGQTDLDVFVLEGDQYGSCRAADKAAQGNQVARWNALGGQEYYVVVDGYGANSGSYTLTADCSGQAAPPDPQKIIIPMYFPLVYR